jgi:hypothetical protein
MSFEESGEAARQAKSPTTLPTIGDVAGEWLDVIWEPSQGEPSQVSHFTIEASEGRISVRGESYAADSFKKLGSFHSRDAGHLADGCGIYYQFEGEEARRSGPRTKKHNGVGLYRFHKSADETLTFEGSFLAHEESWSRYVEGWRLTEDERVQFKTAHGKKKLFRKLLGEKKRKTHIEQKLFARLEKHVAPEVMELRANLAAKNPMATGFLLRKILEKLLYLAFAKNGIRHLIEHPPGSSQAEGSIYGLKAIIAKATETEVGGERILTLKTARELDTRTKYLLDNTVHLGGADMEMILDCLPSLKSAYDELLKKLPARKP